MTDLVDVPSGYVLKSETAPWTVVAEIDDVPIDRGVAALVDQIPVALFRLSSLDDGHEEWHAVDHLDPQTGAPVIARGLVGSHQEDGVVFSTVSSPLSKRRYDLATGTCVDADAGSLRVFEVMLVDGRVLVR